MKYENEDLLKMSSEEELDDRLAFEVRRALLQDAPVPDADEAFAEFRRRNSKESGGRNASFPLIPIISVAAACIAALLIFLLFNNNDDNTQTIDEPIIGEVVYKAAPQIADISIAIGDKTVAASDDDAKASGITVSKDNEITLSEADIDDHDVTTLMIPQGKVAHITLDDGTKVSLSADSRLIFPRQFYANAPREVKLYGEAFFEVARDEKRPFIVYCGDMHTKVLGTKFNMRAFHGEKAAVTLVSGSVSVSKYSENGGEGGNGSGDADEVVLTPSQTATLTADGKITVSEADLDVATSWLKGEFYFDGQTLREILIEIGRWYNMDVVFVNTEHINEQLHFNGERDWSATEVVRHLRMICDAGIVIKEGKLVVE